MTLEGTVGITAALRAGSVALLGFGLDSAIEGLASVIVIWRFTGSRRLSETAERRAERLVAVTFFLLAPYIAQDAIRALLGGEHPATSGRLKHDWALAPLRVRGLDRVRLHADLTILAKLSCALSRARGFPLAA